MQCSRCYCDSTLTTTMPTRGNQSNSECQNVIVLSPNLSLDTGDRYVGFDYANKKPLEDFVLQPGPDFLGGGSATLAMLQSLGSTPSASATTATTARFPSPQAKQRPLVSSLPVVAMLGRQHRVDAIYHDLYDDNVYIFSGMKFYAHRASDFKVSSSLCLACKVHARLRCTCSALYASFHFRSQVSCP